MFKLYQKTKSALKKWFNYSAAIDNKKLMDNARPEKLRNAMKDIPRRKLKTLSKESKVKETVSVSTT